MLLCPFCSRDFDKVTQSSPAPCLPMVPWLSLFMPQNAHSHWAIGPLPVMYHHLQDDRYHLFLQPRHTLVMLHADTRMSKLVCLGPPPSHNPKHRIKWPFPKGPPLWDFLSRKTVLIRSPTYRKPKGQEGRLVCLRDGQLPHSYSPHRLIALQFFQLLCLKASQTVLLSPVSFVPQPLSYLL